MSSEKGRNINEIGDNGSIDKITKMQVSEMGRR